MYVQCIPVVALEIENVFTIIKQSNRLHARALEITASCNRAKQPATTS